MRKSIDDKVEKALQMNEQTDERRNIANSRVALQLKKFWPAQLLENAPNIEWRLLQSIPFEKMHLYHLHYCT